MQMRLTDDDYELTEGAAWFDVGDFTVRIHMADEGLIIDTYDRKLLEKTGDPDEALLTSTYAFTNELSATED